MRFTGTPSWQTVRRPGSGSLREDRPATTSSERPLRIWALGGGKGGIGKSFLAANLATVAARTGRRVLLVDADLGGANLHTCLGVRSGTRVNLSDYLCERVVDLEKVAVETPVPGLRLILGALEHAGAPETSRDQRDYMIASIRKMPVDLVIFDLASGTGRSTLDFFIETDESFLVTTPEPTALENAYAFLRASFYRRLARAMSTSPVRDLIREAMDRRNERGIRTPRDLLREIDRIDSTETERFREVISQFRPRLLLNQVRSREEIKLGFSIQSVCQKFYGVAVDYTGYISFDDFVWRSVKERRPLVLAYPQSDAALYIRRIVKKMLDA